MRAFSPGFWRFARRIATLFSFACLSMAAQLPPGLASARPLELGPAETAGIAGHLSVLRDPSRSLTLEEVLELDRAGGFQPLPGNFSGGYDRLDYWLRLTLLRREGFPPVGWLRLGPAYLDSVTVYAQAAGKSPALSSSYQEVRLGDHIPLSARPTVHHEFVMPVALPDGEPIELYIHLSSSSSLSLFGAVHTEEGLRRHSHRDIFIQTLYFGAGLAIFFILLAFALLTRDPLFFFFAPYVLANLAYNLAMEGMQQFLLPEAPPWLPDMMVSVGIGAKIFLYNEFWRHYFKRIPVAWVRYYQRFISVVGVLVILSYFAGYYAEFSALVLPALIPGFLLVLVLILWNSAADMKINYLAFAALAVSAATYVVAILQLMRVLPAGLSGEVNLVQVGSVIDILLISIAIIQRRWRVEKEAYESIRQAEHRAVDIAREMTRELHENKERLEVALEAEHAALERQQQFLAMVSHEYRTPLSIIQGNLDLMDKECRGAGKEDPPGVAKMRSAVQRLVEVMEVSLHRSRLMDFRAEGSFREVPIEKFVAHQVENARWIWPNEQFVLYCSIPDSTVRGDLQLLNTALFNLLDNARKYRIAGTPVEVACTLSAGNARITVSNRTALSPSADTAALFGKYRRGQNSGAVPGSGIGLWLARRILEQHGGEVTLEFDGVDRVTATIAMPLLWCADDV